MSYILDRHYIVQIICVVVFMLVVFVSPARAHAQTATGTATFQIDKVIDPADFPGTLSPSDFSFMITGNGVNASIGHGDTIELEPGTYAITENGPHTFNPGEWTVLWAGDLCSGHYPATESGDLVVTQSDVDKNMPTNPYRCTAQNQYKPGTVKVEKEIVGTSTSPSDFSFRMSGDDPIQFDNSGINFVDIPAGEYAVTEVPADGYTAELSAGCAGTIENHENVTCTITNTFVSDDDGGGDGDDDDDDNGNGGGGNDDDNGGGGGDEDLYRIEGYVWHDDNENTEWDGFDDDDAATVEDELAGWTVEITNGTDTFSTTTDPTGFYYFEVPAGTWTISEDLMDGWKVVTPVDNNHEVTVPDAPTVSMHLGARIFSFIVPTAHAAVLDTFGPFNFGNNESSGGGGNDDGDSGSGEDSDSSGGGSRPRCDALTITTSGAGHMLTWETHFGSSLSITQEGTEIFSSDDDDTVDNGNAFVTTADATYVLTVTRGGREDTCTLKASDGGNGSGGTGGGRPDGRVLGDQVDVVPLGAADTGAGGHTPLAPQPTQTTLIAAFASLAPRSRYAQ